MYLYDNKVNDIRGCSFTNGTALLGGVVYALTVFTTPITLYPLSFTNSQV